MATKSEKNGFTLIELLITIFLVGVGLVGVISFFNANLNSQFETKNEVVAAGLAQESTELVRNVADYNYLNGNAWYASLSAKNGVGICQAIDYTSLTSHLCVPKAIICFSQATGRYYECSNLSSPEKTDFNLNVAISLDSSSGPDLDSGGCMKVITTVSWSGGAKNTTTADIICKPRQ